MFDVGDLVVCVDGIEGPDDGQEKDSDHVYVGDVLRISEIDHVADDIDTDPVTLWFETKPKHSYPSRYFEKLTAPDTEVSRLIRACKPVREGQPA